MLHCADLNTLRNLYTMGTPVLVTHMKTTVAKKLLNSKVLPCAAPACRERDWHLSAFCPLQHHGESGAHLSHTIVAGKVTWISKVNPHCMVLSILKPMKDVIEVVTQQL